MLLASVCHKTPASYINATLRLHAIQELNGLVACSSHRERVQDRVVGDYVGRVPDLVQHVQRHFPEAELRKNGGWDGGCRQCQCLFGTFDTKQSDCLEWGKMLPRRRKNE